MQYAITVQVTFHQVYEYLTGLDSVPALASILNNKINKLFFGISRKLITQPSAVNYIDREQTIKHRRCKTPFYCMQKVRKSLFDLTK